MSLKCFLHFLQNVIYICALYLLHTVVLSNLCCVVGREKYENVLKLLLKLGGNGKRLGNVREIYMKSRVFCPSQNSECQDMPNISIFAGGGGGVLS